MNQQPAEKRVTIEASFSTTLDVHSIFHTIQGEGPFTGRSAVFVRLAGCNLQCPKCDTEYTTNRHNLTPFEILSKVLDLDKTRCSIVVITGGEPFRQDIQPLVEILLGNGYKVQIETNGTLPPPRLSFYELCSLDVSSPAPLCYIVCSPKTGSVHKELTQIICAYKYVLAYGEQSVDGLPTKVLDHSAHPCVARPHKGFNGTIYLQPTDDYDVELNEANRAAVIHSCMKHGYTLQLQIHKLIEME